MAGGHRAVESHLVQTVTDEFFHRSQFRQEDLRWYGQRVKDFTGS